MQRYSQSVRYNRTVLLAAPYLTLQLFYLKESGPSNKESLRQQLRDICISAAVDGQPTVLVISSSVDIKRQDWEDVYKLMNEGTENEWTILNCMMEARHYGSFKFQIMLV